jgi:hypothetical protein
MPIDLIKPFLQIIDKAGKPTFANGGRGALLQDVPASV